LPAAFFNLEGMKLSQFELLVALVLFSIGTLFVSMYLLAKFNSLFKSSIRNELVRKNVVVWMIAVCIITVTAPTGPDFYGAFATNKLRILYPFLWFAATVDSVVLFNICWLIVRYLDRKGTSFRKKAAIVLLTIIICSMLVSIPNNYLGNKYLGDGGSFKNLHVTLLFNLYTGCMIGLIYITMSYVDLERKRKLNEKELEVTKLQQLKTKAELDALHSKINPHFLYNALNSIADLAVTDGKRARKMTIALADLFRYSINYSDHNYSTIQEEVEMTEVYLEIEKIRFEDQLNYSIHLDKDVKHYLIPRFLLQPVVENAVKHGLKTTGKLTEINITVKNGSGGLQIAVADNGPAFPDELIPGYGMKSMYDKLDLLFPSNYDIHFTNTPEKKVTINIHKLMKNEPAI
jgi:two-component system, LytTR family, sensor kinase